MEEAEVRQHKKVVLSQDNYLLLFEVVHGGLGVLAGAGAAFAGLVVVRHCRVRCGERWSRF
jgi:hypothetical protein